ncbi:MAG: hypothetical protein ACPL6D_16715, partial [Thermodesulfobacteriota bacterium]
AETAMAQSIAMIIYMIMAPLVGTLVERIRPRKVILPGIFLRGLGLILYRQIRTFNQFYLFFGLIVGTGVTCLSIAPFTRAFCHTGLSEKDWLVVPRKYQKLHSLAS